jgi:hypothetical protein
MSVWCWRMHPDNHRLTLRATCRHRCSWAAFVLLLLCRQVTQARQQGAVGDYLVLEEWMLSAPQEVHTRYVCCHSLLGSPSALGPCGTHGLPQEAWTCSACCVVCHVVFCSRRGADVVPMLVLNILRIMTPLERVQ